MMVYRLVSFIRIPRCFLPVWPRSSQAVSQSTSPGLGVLQTCDGSSESVSQPPSHIDVGNGGGKSGFVGYPSIAGVLAEAAGGGNGEFICCVLSLVV